MPSIRNNRLVQSLPTDYAPNRYSAWHEPFGDFGLWNGQFEQYAPIGDPIPVSALALAGPYQGPEGWEIYTYANGIVERTSVQALAGAYSLRGGQAGAGAGGYAVSKKFFPVDEDRDYMLTASFYGTNVACTKLLAIACYDSAMAALAPVVVVNWAATNPAATWTRNFKKVGPNGDAAWPAGTAYARPIVGVQNNAALTGHYTYVDDVQFQQLKFADSTGIRLLADSATDAVLRTYTGAGVTVATNSAMALTLPEPGIIHIRYEIGAIRAITASRTSSYSWQAYIGGAGVGIRYLYGAIQNYYRPLLLSTSSGQAAGTYAIDLRINVVNAGDQVEATGLIGYAYWTRQN